MKKISYDEFRDWHTAHGNDKVSETLMHRMYRIYLQLIKRHGVEKADELICGHIGWGL